MKNVLIYLALIFAFLFRSLYSIVILVHGTFATSEPWARPGGAFYDCLETEARRHNHHLIPFTWNGGNLHKDRIQGAEALAKVLLSYPMHEKKFVIGHSHGGTVIILASHLLSDPLKKMWSEKKTYQELRDELIAFLNKQYLMLTTHDAKKSINVNENMYEVQRELLKAYISIHKALKTTTNKVVSIHRTFLIDRVYCLGTPIDPILYKPSMNIIDHLFSFYSQWDVVQTGFGFYRKLFPDQERVINFRIKIDEEKWYTPIHPFHWNLHHPIIAHYILDIPYGFQKRKIGGFEQYTEKYNGEIIFDKHGIHYYVDKKPTEEREKEEEQNSKSWFKTLKVSVCFSPNDQAPANKQLTLRDEKDESN